MRRAVLTLGGTVAGLAALLSFKTHSVAAAAPSAPPAAASASPTQPMVKATGSHAKAKSSSKPARTVAGTVVHTQYGPVQVAVTVAGSKITKVTVLQRTDDGAESDEIDGTAIPKLTSEALVAQSAHIDAVSGATYTSSGYVQSLQSALDKAGA